jgi:hypothetical protein
MQIPPDPRCRFCSDIAKMVSDHPHFCNYFLSEETPSKDMKKFSKSFQKLKEDIKIFNKNAGYYQS